MNPLNFATKVAYLLGSVLFLGATDRVWAGSHEIPFLLKDSSYVSAAIYDNQGRMRDSYRHSYPRTVLKNFFKLLRYLSGVELSCEFRGNLAMRAAD